jgi:hypothetical protein
MDAQRAIYAANPECATCDDGWLDRCAAAVCRAETKAFDTCVQRAHCADGFACEKCDVQRRDYLRCFWKTLDDPKDVGGCYSGSHRCWSMPACNDDGTARP